MARGTTDEGEGLELLHFLRTGRDDIVQAWVARVRQLPASRALPHERLVDHIPMVLDHLADMLDRMVSGADAELPVDVAERHAEHRIREGFDLYQVGVELALLRTVILERWERQTCADLEAERYQHRLLNMAFDRAIITSIDRYAGARMRSLEALEQVSSLVQRTGADPAADGGTASCGGRSSGGAA